MTSGEYAIRQIRDLIVKGHLGPGQRLPAEGELADQLDVSRNALREAVRALCDARVLEVRRGDGTFVSDLEPATLLSGLSLTLDLMQDDALVEIFEVRRLLEPPATGLAASRATEENIDTLTSSLERLNQAQTNEELIALDLEFHREVVQITGNATLCALIDAIGRRALNARVWRGVVEDGPKNFTFEQHSRIVDAIRERDSEVAVAASTLHVTASEQWLKHMLAR